MDEEINKKIIDDVDFGDKLLEAFKKDNDNFYFKDYSKNIGKGGFGYVKDIFHKNTNKNYVVKIIPKKNDEEKTGENILTLNINDPHITKIKKIINHKYIKNNEIYYYDIILMEKANLKDLSNLIKNETFYLINKPFEDIYGDNILRFLSKQIIEGLEVLERNEYIHLDIKPGNILIFDNFKLKLTDFSFLTKIDSKNNNVMKFWGTWDYVTPEYYQPHSKLSNNDKKKQDYFALGAVLYSLKYKEKLLDYQKIEDETLNTDLLIEIIQRKMNKIKSSITSDVELNKFLCDLIQYKPEDRPSFEKIYRNKWLNKKSDIKTACFRSDINDINDKGNKLLFELNKNDFLYQHKKEKEQNKKFKFKL